MMAATQKSSKKRSAPTQSGPTPKKAHLAKPAKGKEPAAVKKRSRPITLPVQEENSESDEGEFEGFGGGEDEEYIGLDDEVRRDEMDVDSSNAPPKDPNGKFPLFFHALPLFAIPVLLIIHSVDSLVHNVHADSYFWTALS